MLERAFADWIAVLRTKEDDVVSGMRRWWKEVGLPESDEDVAGKVAAVGSGASKSHLTDMDSGRKVSPNLDLSPKLSHPPKHAEPKPRTELGASEHP